MLFEYFPEGDSGFVLEVESIEDAITEAAYFLERDSLPWAGIIVENYAGEYVTSFQVGNFKWPRRDR